MMKRIPLTTPQAIAFDWDGTIVNSLPATMESIQKVLTEFKTNPNEIKQNYRADRTVRENFDTIFGNEAKKAFELFFSYYSSIAKNKVTLLPFAQEMFEFLSKKDIPIAIVSNKEREHILLEMEALLPTFSFYQVVGGDDTPKRKPSGDPVRYAFRNLPIPLTPENVWMVGDSQFDIECAYDATCMPIFIGCGEHCYDKSFMGDYLTRQKQEHNLMHLKDLAEFLNILQSVL